MRRRLNRVCKAFARDRAGGTMPLIAVGLVVTMAAGAVGIDLVKARAMQQSLSLAADAAALAAAPRLPDVNAARQAALDYVERNMPSAEYGTVLVPADIEFGSWDAATRTFTPSGGPGNTVRVTTRMSQANGNAVATSLANVIGFESLDVSASAVAGRSGIPCVLVLDPSERGAARIKSKAVVETIDCGVQINSTASKALQMDGNSVLTSSDICVGGTAHAAGSNTVSPQPREYCPGRPDPLAAMTPPGVGSCDHHDQSYEATSVTIGPGVYCGGLELDGNAQVTLDPGLYVMKDGPLDLSGGSRLSGSGVTIFLTGEDASLNFDGGSVIDMSAPIGGPLQGMLIFQDRNFDTEHDWDGDSTTDLKGVVYLPTGALHADSANQITPQNSCTVLIVEELVVINKSSVSVDFSSSACRNSLPAAYRRGVVLLQ